MTKIDVLNWRSLRGLLTLLGAVLLIACGVDDTPSKDSASTRPEPTAAINAAPDPMPSTAQSLPPPALAVAPVMTAPIPATTDEPPPLAPGVDSDRIAVEQSLARRMPVPTVFRTSLAAGLEEPTDLAVLPDATVFFTQRRRGLFVQRAGEAAARELFTGAGQGVGRDSPEILALAVDPAFERNRFVFVYLRSTLSEEVEHSVVRLALNESATRVTNRSTILRVGARRPAAPNEPLRSASGLRFGPDSYLYVGIDDGGLPDAAQSNKTLAGKVLRIDREGQAAPGNNAGEGGDARVYARGLRQPAALAFDAASETLLVGERRATQPDEIMLVRPGANAGWDPRCAALRSGYCAHLAEQREPPRPVGIVTGWRGAKAGEGLAAMAPLRGESWGAWHNGFAVAFESAQRLDLLKFDGQGRLMQAVTALERAGAGFRAVGQGPDGLYVATSGKPGGDQIWRLNVR